MICKKILVLAGLTCVACLQFAASCAKQDQSRSSEPVISSGTYYGRIDNAKAVGVICARRVYENIDEFQEIRRLGYGNLDAYYWILLEKASDKFYNAVSMVAAKRKLDAVVEKNSEHNSKDSPDITKEVIDALGGANK